MSLRTKPKVNLDKVAKGLRGKRKGKAASSAASDEEDTRYKLYGPGASSTTVDILAAAIFVKVAEVTDDDVFSGRFEIVRIATDWNACRRLAAEVLEKARELL